MSFSLINMSILSRFYVICSKIAEILVQIYNHIFKDVTPEAFQAYQEKSQSKYLTLFKLPNQLKYQKTFGWRKKKKIDSLSKHSSVKDVETVLNMNFTTKDNLEDFGEPV